MYLICLYHHELCACPPMLYLGRNFRRIWLFYLFPFPDECSGLLFPTFRKLAFSSLKRRLFPSMGAHASKDAQGSSRSQTEKSQRTGVDSIDYGSVLPNGLYPTSQQEYDLHTVRNLILARKLAPFYKGNSMLENVPRSLYTNVSLLFWFRSR